jgi:hypothetical protein
MLPLMPVRVTDWVGGKVYDYEDLEAYYASPFWLVTKQRYEEDARLHECFICGQADYQLHHTRYDRLGMELDDLIPLCEAHHYEIEKYIDKGIPGVTRQNAHEKYKSEWEKRRDRDLHC